MLQTYSTNALPISWSGCMQSLLRLDFQWFIWIFLKKTMIPVELLGADVGHQHQDYHGR